MAERLIKPRKAGQDTYQLNHQMLKPRMNIRSPKYAEGGKERTRDSKTDTHASAVIRVCV